MNFFFEFDGKTPSELRDGAIYKDKGVRARYSFTKLPLIKEETGKAKKEVYGCGERGHGSEVEVTEEDTVDRNNWRRKIRSGDP